VAEGPEGSFVQPTLRKHVWYWGLGIAGAAVLGIALCWAIPLARVKYAASKYPVGDPAAVASLGGPDSGVALVMNYLRCPVIPGDWKADAMSILRSCVETCSERGARPLAQSLSSRDYRVRWIAADSLRDMGPRAGPAVPELICALTGDDPTLCADSAKALGAIGRDASAAVPELRQATQANENPSARIAAAEALWRIDQTLGDEAVTILVREVGNKRTDTAAPFYRRDAAHALGRIGPPAKSAVPALIEALSDNFRETRSAAAGALGRIGPDARAAVPALVKALSDQERFVRLIAARALGRIGKEAKDALPALERLVGDKEEDVRKAAAQALARIQSEE